MKIIADNIGKRFTLHQWIFKDLSFEFNIAHRYGIQGPNGSGKSTLLSILSGINLPSKGTLNYYKDDKAIDGLLWHQYLTISTPYSDLIDYLTLEELLDFYLNFKKFQSSIDKNNFLEIVFLAQHKNKLVKHFSSGMKQRLKLALAILTESDVLLLDEPCTNLDVNTTEWYYSLLNQYTKNKLVIVASNDARDFEGCTNYINLQKGV